MSAVIKSNATADAGVRRLSAPRSAPLHVGPTQAELEIAALRAQLEAASKRLQEGEAECRRLQAEASEAFHQGEAAGREAGRREADERRADALRLLENGIVQAGTRFSDALAALERLAVLVARESVGKILGNPELHAEHLAHIIRAQVDGLAGAAVLHIAVSRQDFPHDEEIQRLSHLLGRSDLKLCGSGELKAGECQIKASLGAVEVGVAQQWGRLSELLGELAASEVRP